MFFHHQLNCCPFVGFVIESGRKKLEIRPQIHGRVWEVVAHENRPSVTKISVTHDEWSPKLVVAGHRFHCIIYHHIHMI